MDVGGGGSMCLITWRIGFSTENSVNLQVYLLHVLSQCYPWFDQRGSFTIPLYRLPVLIKIQVFTEQEDNVLPYLQRVHCELSFLVLDAYMHAANGQKV